MLSLNVIVMTASSATFVALFAGTVLERVGAVVSTPTESAVEDDEALPARSKWVAVIDHVPDWMLGIVQVAALAVTVTEHCCLALVLVLFATNRTTPPSSAVVVLTSRLVADVMLSVLDDPVSEPAARSGTAGAAGAVRSGDDALVPLVIRRAGYCPDA
jgi:hypothetical protein